MARPRQVSDEQIMSAMRNHVLAQGPNVPLEAVASQLEITSPAILKRFGTRRALMLAALRPPEAPEWIKFVQKGPGDSTLQTQLREIFDRITAFMTEVIPCMIALRESGIPIEEVHARSKAPVMGLKALQRWLALARKRGLVTVPETDTAAFVMLGSLQSRAFFRHMAKLPFSERAERRYLEELIRFFTRALSS